jgi:hypothetical protein
MPRLSELDEFLDEDLVIPLKSKQHPQGRDYIVEAPDADTGLWLQQQMKIGAAIYDGRLDPDEGELDEDEERDFLRKVFGPNTFDEMMSDGVKWPSMKRAGQAALAWILADSERAEQAWQGKAPEEPEPANRAERRATRKSGSKKKTGTGAASGSNRRASTSGTNPPR